MQLGKFDWQAPLWGSKWDIEHEMFFKVIGVLKSKKLLFFQFLIVLGLYSPSVSILQVFQVFVWWRVFHNQKRRFLERDHSWAWKFKSLNDQVLHPQLPFHLMVVIVFKYSLIGVEKHPRFIMLIPGGFWCESETFWSDKLSLFYSDIKWVPNLWCQQMTYLSEIQYHTKL